MRCNKTEKIKEDLNDQGNNRAINQSCKALLEGFAIGFKCPKNI